MKRSASLKRATPLKQRSPLRSSTTLSRSSALKPKRTTARVLDEPYWSVFTEQDMSRCLVTGDAARPGLPIDVHHVFPGAHKAASEAYGYVVPLRRDVHEACHNGDPDGVWEALRRSCEAEFLAHHGDAAAFAAAFGRHTGGFSEGKGHIANGSEREGKEWTQ